MILTVTPNPSLDLLFEAAEELRWDDANRMAEPRRRPGGQGINLTRAARALGGRSVALALLGGPTGTALARQLEEEGTTVVAVPVAQETRTFVAVREPSGRSLLINSRGPHCEPHEGRALLDALHGAIRTHRPTWVVSSGSIPPGLDPDLHMRAGEIARAAGVRFIADCDGEALRRAADSGVCDILVPNRHEALRLAGADPAEPVAAGRIARALLAYARATVIKLGELGAVAATPEATWHALPPRTAGGSAVGAGDAFLAALLMALDRGRALEEALRAAVAAGSAVLLSTGAALVDTVQVTAVQAATVVRRLPG